MTRRARIPGFLLLFSFVASGSAVAQEDERVPQTFDWSLEEPIPATTPWGQAVDTASTRMILQWTTMPEYTTPVVNHLPEHPTTVSPTEHFGHPIGRPGFLHKVDEVYGYMEALAGSSPRVNFGYLGETEEGRRLALVQVGSEANLARLDEIKAGMAALADPRGTDEAEAQRLIAELPAIYAFYAGLHSPETGPPEMVMEMAYRLAVSDDPMIRKIRDEVVVFIVPVAEPDGRDKVVDWHRRYNQDVFKAEDRVAGPPYWGKYIFHDNNRDGLQLSAALTRELVNLFLEWHYPVGHDLHESVPYIYVSTGTGPYNPTVDPIAVSEWQWMSNYEVTELTAYGLPGVWTHGFYSGWYPGYLLWVTNTRNAVGRFYETFGNSIPNTMERELGDRQTRTEWYRPNPPREKTIWSLRNNTNYMQTAALTAVHLVAENRARVLENYWKKSNNALNKGRDEAPYAYVVAQDQPRKADASYMLNLVRRQGIEVHRAEEDGTFGETSVAEGDYVIRMDQPYRNFVLTLMDKQEFPEDAPSPYDDVAWTYPLMFNVSVQAVDDAGIQEMDMALVSAEIGIAGSHTRVAGRRARDVVHVVKADASAHALSLRFDMPDVPMRVAESAIPLERDTLPAGSWIIAGDALDGDQVRSLAETRGLEVYTISSDDVSEVATHEMDLPRIALLHTWSRTQDEGWARYSLDQAGVPYTYIAETELEGRNLRSEFDVILFPHQGSRSTAKRILQGVDPSKGPIAYTRTAEYPSHGTPDESEDITGGMGFAGLAALRSFVEDGGTLLTIGSASTVSVGFGFLRDVNLSPVGSRFIPGSILAAKVKDASNPITYGYDSEFPVYHQWGPYLSVPDSKDDGIAVEYGGSEGLLLSGVARSAGSLVGDPAIYAEQVGEGWVVVYGFDALHRHQNLGNHALVWNAVMNWNDLDARSDTDAPTAVTDGEGSSGPGR